MPPSQLKNQNISALGKAWQAQLFDLRTVLTPLASPKNVLSNGASCRMCSRPHYTYMSTNPQRCTLCLMQGRVTEILFDCTYILHALGLLLKTRVKGELPLHILGQVTLYLHSLLQRLPFAKNIRLCKLTSVPVKV